MPPFFPSVTCQKERCRLFGPTEARQSGATLAASASRHSQQAFFSPSLWNMVWKIKCNFILRSLTGMSPHCWQEKWSSYLHFVLGWQHLLIMSPKKILFFSPSSFPPFSSFSITLNFYLHLLPYSTHTPTEHSLEKEASVLWRQKRLFIRRGSRASGWSSLCQRGEEGQTTGQEYDM